MVIVDTNVISETSKPNPSSAVLRWLDTQPSDELFTTATVIAELAYGCERMPNGRRKQLVWASLEAVILEDFPGRILPFDTVAALEFGSLFAMRQAAGHPIIVGDAEIAAVCLANGATLATRNTKDFEGLGIRLINPWQPTP
jgi:toxin FitB